VAKIVKVVHVHVQVSFGRQAVMVGLENMALCRMACGKNDISLTSALLDQNWPLISTGRKDLLGLFY